MGILQQEGTARQHTLSARTLIGRSRRCDLRLGSDRVSGEHASLWWDGEQWWLKDLGSRNGTTVGELLLEAGAARQLQEGEVLCFGGARSWVLQSATPPVAVAVPLDRGAPVQARDGLLELPEAEAPELVLMARPDGSWVAEDEERSFTVGDGFEVEAGGRRWRLHLPETSQVLPTRDASPLRLPQAALHFAVSRDEEEVSLTLSHGARRLQLEPRAHLYVLLLLARARLADAHLPEAEQGWVDRQTLCEMLRMGRNSLNMNLHRARRQLASAGVENTAALLERRAQATALRLGPRVLSIEVT